MLTRAEVESQWDVVKPAIQRRWRLGGEELDEAKHSAGRLVGLIEQRTGTQRDEIEAFLERQLRGAGRVAQRAVQQSIEQHPLEGTLLSFAAGFAAGKLIGIAYCRARG